jgi:hypothetical protein
VFARADASEITAIALDKGGEAIIVTGDLVAGDGARFRSEASKYDDAFVLLESDGGSLIDALDIGETIRLKGYSTAVINGSSCNSACALIWLAGTPRMLSRSGKIGFHAAYTDKSGSAQESGVANAMVGRYLTLLNLPEKAIIFATSSPPSSLSWLTASNYVSTGIDLKIIDDFDFLHNENRQASPIASAKSKPMVWRQLDYWTVYVDSSLSNGCFLFGSFKNQNAFRVGINRTSGGYYILLGNPAWESLKAGQEYDVQFQFDAHSPWNVPTVGLKMGDYIYLKGIFDDSNFWTEFVNSSALEITRNGQPVTRMAFSGTKAAFNELVACQKYEDAHTRPRDPFAN